MELRASVDLWPLLAGQTALAWPRWLLMWSLAVVVFAACKGLTWWWTRVRGAPWWVHPGYLLAWPGLDADAFLRGPRPDVVRPSPREWAWALATATSGVGLLWGVVHRVPDDLVRAWVGMTGVALLLHFGSFRLLSCAWRSLGVEARPLMDAPVRSRGLAEFWGRRWNTAFRDLTHRFLFRPLAPRLGAPAALAAGFVASGLVHDLVISVPAGGGYGLPTLYFCIQVAGVLCERSALGRRAGLGSGWRGWAFTVVLLLAPAGLLFHAPFRREVVLPFLTALGAC